MLKAKRIAKIILCISIAFSMFIYVSANIIYNNGTLIGNTDKTPTGNNASYNYDIDYKITTGNYNLIIKKPQIIVNEINISNCIIKFRVSYEGFGNYKEYSCTYNGITTNCQLISNTDNEIIINIDVEESYNNQYIVGDCILQYVIYSNLSGQTFTNNTVDNVLIIKDNINNTKKLNDNITNIINTLINNIANIFNFITNKPWIILLGITVSLLSFLIYKSKTIIR